MQRLDVWDHIYHKNGCSHSFLDFQTMFIRSNCTFYITFQSYTSMHPRKFKFGGALSSLKCKKPHQLVASRTWKVLYLDTKTESEDDFDVHNCVFEVPFDECAQLHIQWCICIHQVESCLRAYTSQIRRWL